MWGSMNNIGKAPARTGQGGSREASPDILRLRSEDLFAHGKQVVIEHAGREYRLRLTAGNKLILTA